MKPKIKRLNVMLYLEQDATAKEFCVLRLDDEGYAKQIYHWKTKQIYMLDAIQAMNPKTTIQFR